MCKNAFIILLWSEQFKSGHHPWNEWLPFCLRLQTLPLNFEAKRVKFQPSSSHSETYLDWVVNTLVESMYIGIPAVKRRQMVFPVFSNWNIAFSLLVPLVLATFLHFFFLFRLHFRVQWSTLPFFLSFFYFTSPNVHTYITFISNSTVRPTLFGQMLRVSFCVGWMLQFGRKKVY